LPSVALRVAPPEPDKPAVPSAGDSPPFPERSHANHPPPSTRAIPTLKAPTRGLGVARARKPSHCAGSLLDWRRCDGIVEVILVQPQDSARPVTEHCL